MKQSPPMPVDCGSVTHSVALAAMAASMALPPWRSTSSPTCTAMGWLVATMPFALITTERPGYWMSRIDCRGLGCGCRCVGVPRRRIPGYALPPVAGGPDDDHPTVTPQAPKHQTARGPVPQTPAPGSSPARQTRRISSAGISGTEAAIRVSNR